ncbi:MAG TPA: hypothetical protein VGB76_03170 [Pyrinomonadaceae bacterium]
MSGNGGHVGLRWTPAPSTTLTFDADATQRSVKLGLNQATLSTK